MSLIAEPKEPVLTTPPAVLIVDDDAAVVEMIQEPLQTELGCRVRAASTISQARRILATEPIELLVLDIGLPDGDGLSLLKALRSRHPFAQAIVITGAPSIEKMVTALRDGATDLLPKPFTTSVFVERARKALHQYHRFARNEARIELLKGAVRRLNQARRVVSKKVDLLCNDLVGAYGELAKQLDQVRTQEGFRNLLADARDLEQLLCHAMDWLLRQLGYSNIAVWLAGHDQFQLGAYMKHTIPGEAPLVEAMSRGLLPRVIRENFIHVEASEAGRILSSAEARLLPDQTILASHCTYLGESLAALVMFREGGRPFTAADVALVQEISPIFAVSLAAAVRVEPASGPEDESDLAQEDPPDEPDENPKPKRRKKHPNDADWWKTGEPPPF